MYTKEALGVVVRARRLALGQTQQQLGEAAGYGKGPGAGVAISRLESGLARPKPDRFAGIAAALGMEPIELEEAALREAAPSNDDSSEAGGGQRESIRARAERLQRDYGARTDAVEELVAKYNEAQDRAESDFLKAFIKSAEHIDDAPQPDPVVPPKDSSSAKTQAAFRIEVASNGLAQHLATGALGGAAGAAVGGAAAYSAFAATMTFGTASTGAAISGLSGIAATNATLAALGGGALTAGGAGIAGGTALLVGIVAAPAALIAGGVVAWSVHRNKKRQDEARAKLDAAEKAWKEALPGFLALERILPLATELLTYIGLHGGHAFKKWARTLPDPPIRWGDLSPAQQATHQDFVQVAASQLAVTTLDYTALLINRGEELHEQAQLFEEVISQATRRVEDLV